MHGGTCMEDGCTLSLALSPLSLVFAFSFFAASVLSDLELIAARAADRFSLSTFDILWEDPL